MKDGSRETVRALSGLALVATSCGPLSGSDPAFWEPARDLGGIAPTTGGAGGAWADASTTNGGAPSSGGLAGSNDSGGAPAISSECALTFSAATVSARGRYSPRNVGAIWIETPDGRFVKTLSTWGGPVRLPNATAWRTVSGQNVVDAISGATRAGHGPVDATWNCTDTSRRPIPGGPYLLAITFAEDNAVAAVAPPLHVARLAFDTGKRPGQFVAEDHRNFVGMTIDLR